MGLDRVHPHGGLPRAPNAVGKADLPLTELGKQSMRWTALQIAETFAKSVKGLLEAMVFWKAARIFLRESAERGARMEVKPTSEFGTEGDSETAKRWADCC